MNPGNRLQQRWDPELECSRLQKKSRDLGRLCFLCFLTSCDAQMPGEGAELNAGVSLGLNPSTVAMSGLQTTLSNRG